MPNKIFVSLFLVAALGLMSPARAQDDATAVDAAAALETTIVENGLSSEAIADETVTEDDLNAKTPGRFNFLKKIVRTVQRTITFDPIKKAELRIEEAHENLLTAKKIAEENPTDADAQEKVEKALEKFADNIEKVKDQAADIKEKGGVEAGNFLQKIADFQIKQQKVLDKLEEKLPAAVFAKVQAARQRTITNQSEVMTAVADNAQQITERFSAALASQPGSDFREFKNMEMLERVAEFVPAEARAAIEEAQNAARGRFEADMQGLTPADRNEVFVRYMANITGDPVNQMRALDNLKSQANLPEDFFGEIENAKEKTVGKFEERLRRFADPAEREQFLATLADGSVANLRVIQQIKENVPDEIKQQIQQKEQEAVARFKAEFVDDPDAQSRAEKFQELAEKMRENPDPTMFAALAQLEQTLPPAQAQFVQNLKNEASTGLVDKFREQGDVFFKRIESFDANAIQQLTAAQTNVPPAAQALLNRAVNQQIDSVQARIQNSNDPAQFERLQQQFTQNPELKQQIEQRFTNFGAQLQNKEQEIGVIKQQIENNFQERIEQQQQIRQEQGQPDFSELEQRAREQFIQNNAQKLENQPAGIKPETAPSPQRIENQPRENLPNQPIQNKPLDATRPQPLNPNIRPGNLNQSAPGEFRPQAQNPAPQERPAGGSNNLGNTPPPPAPAPAGEVKPQ